jgi:hypothetical protein
MPALIATCKPLRRERRGVLGAPFSQFGPPDEDCVDPAEFQLCRVKQGRFTVGIGPAPALAAFRTIRPLNLLQKNLRKPFWRNIILSRWRFSR